MSKPHVHAQSSARRHGDHAQIIVRPNGIEVDEYSHD